MSWLNVGSLMVLDMLLLLIAPSSATARPPAPDKSAAIQNGSNFDLMTPSNDC